MTIYNEAIKILDQKAIGEQLKKLNMLKFDKFLSHSLIQS